VLIGEATNTNFIVFDLTRPGLEPTINRTRGEHAKHYTTDAVEKKFEDIDCKVMSKCNVYFIISLKINLFSP
jgi:hypothetical protein